MRTTPEASKNPREYKAEMGVIVYLNNHPDSLEYIASKVAPEDFTTDFNRKVYVKMQEGMKKSEEFDIMSLQSELTTDEMGRITEMLTSNKAVDINETVIDDFINILTEHGHDTDLSIKELSDDEFLKYTESLRNKK